MAIKAEILKNEKYAQMDLTYIHVCACGSGRMWIFRASNKGFLQVVGLPLRSASSDENSHQHLIQRISVTVHGNMASFH